MKTIRKAANARLEKDSWCVNSFTAANTSRNNNGKIRKPQSTKKALTSVQKMK